MISGGFRVLGEEGIATLLKLQVYEQWTFNRLPFLITDRKCLLSAFQLLGIYPILNNHLIKQVKIFKYIWELISILRTTLNFMLIVLP